MGDFLVDLEDLVEDINNFPHEDKDTNYIVSKGLNLLHKSLHSNDEDSLNGMYSIRESNFAQDFVKRQAIVIPPSNEGEPCSFVGKEKYNETIQNVCKGMSCHPLEANCNGTVLRFSPHVNNTVPDYPGRIATSCEITKLRCFSSLSNNGIFYDLAETYGSKHCVVEKTLCSIGNQWFIYEPNETTNRRLVATDSCHTQVVCSDSRRYGFEFFGFQCIQEELICNGTIINPSNITDPSVQNNLNKCRINKRTCVEADWSSVGCYKYEIACNGSTLSNGCTYSQIQSACTNQIPSCRISQMTCNDKLVQNPSDYAGLISDCQISEITCENGQKLIDMNSNGYHNCSVEQLNCNGVNQDSTFNGNLSSCYVQKLSCVPSSKTSSCALLEMVCNTAPSCTIIYQKLPCMRNNTCYVPQNTSWCICPLDRKNSDCSGKRNIICDLHLKEPLCNAGNSLSPQEKLLNADWPCIRNSLSEKVSLVYNLDCRFETPIGNITQDMINANFTYYVINDRFAISEPIQWKLLFKLFNFRKLSDKEAQTTEYLDKEQMEGTKNIRYETPILSEIPDRYWVGNRLYLEVGWNYEKRYVNGLDRRYIDSTTPKLQYNSVTFKNGVRYSLVFGLAAGGIAG